MSPLLPNQGPPLKLTHQPIPEAEIARLRDAVREAADNGKVSVAIVEGVANKLSAPRANVYAAVAFDPNLMVQSDSDVLIAICVGTCQGQGAIENLEKLLALREERNGKGQKVFDIIPRTCLDMCPHSPVCMSRSPHGNAAHPKLKPEGIPELVSTLCD